jgi:predicted MPP superfamily phosphohydrolase
VAMSASNIPLTEPGRVTIQDMNKHNDSCRHGKRLLSGVAVAGAVSTAYMAFEAQWVRCRETELPVPGLPLPWSGTTILHVSDVHAGAFPTNERSLAKVVRWAEPLDPDLVFLTGDILGDPGRSEACLELLSRLHPPLGMFAVTGNHEYGLSKGPLARARDTSGLWTKAGVSLLSDSCVALPPREGAQIILCGADYASGGFGLLDGGAIAQATGADPGSAFPILLIHEPPASDSHLGNLFPLAFAGHTHGGQLRVPAPSGLTPLHNEHQEFLAGIFAWGAGLLVVSRGIGTSFLPFRLMTRPEATLWRLVYTSSEDPTTVDKRTATGGAHGRFARR